VLRSQIEALQLQIEALQLQIEALQNQIEVLQLQIEALKLQIEALKLQIEALKLLNDDTRNLIITHISFNICLISVFFHNKFIFIVKRNLLIVSI